MGTHISRIGRIMLHHKNQISLLLIIILIVVMSFASQSYSNTSYHRKINVTNHNNPNSYVSDHDVNTIVFTQKITKVLQPSHQLIDVIYMNNNRAISFQVKNNIDKKIQFVISFENGEIKVFNFLLANINGVLLQESKSFVIGEEYDRSIITFIKEQFTSHGFRKCLLEKVEQPPNKSRHTGLNHFQRWLCTNNIIEVIEYCANVNNDKFGDLKTLLHNKNVIAITTLNETFKPIQCKKILVLSSKEERKDG